MPRPTYYQCGICEAWHNAMWDGDCRQDDDARFADPEVMDVMHGANGWDEIFMCEIAAWRAGVAQQRETTDHE